MNRSNTRGFSLIEVLVALAIITGPLMVAVSSLNASSRSARFNANHLGIEMLVTDLADELCTATATRLADLSGEEGRTLLGELMDRRVAAIVDPSLREATQKEIDSLRSTDLKITQVGGTEFDRLYRVEVQAKSMLGGVVRAVRLVQVPPRLPGKPKGR